MADIFGLFHTRNSKWGGVVELDIYIGRYVERVGAQNGELTAHFAAFQALSIFNISGVKLVMRGRWGSSRDTSPPPPQELSRLKNIVSGSFRRLSDRFSRKLVVKRGSYHHEPFMVLY